jgi:hypothetical protein
MRATAGLSKCLSSLSLAIEYRQIQRRGPSSHASETEVKPLGDTLRQFGMIGVVDHARCRGAEEVGMLGVDHRKAAPTEPPAVLGERVSARVVREHEVVPLAVVRPPVLGADALEGRLAVGAVEAVEEHPGAFGAKLPAVLVSGVGREVVWQEELLRALRIA